MRNKIREILLVSSLYDNYLFEEDGRLYELLREEYQNLNLSQAPDITHVTTAAEAIEMCIIESRFDLIIATLHIDDMHPVKLAKTLREANVKVPIVLLAYDNKEKKELVNSKDVGSFDRIFIWNGDYRLLIAIIKTLEDQLNVENDTAVSGVQSIILVEDNVKFYSSYLPIIYTEIFNQSQRLISEGVNLTHKFLRMRARPKILLSTNYEQAMAYYEKYEDYVLGVITDINFRRNGVKDPMAGIEFAKAVRERHSDIPILLQSSNSKFEEDAKAMGMNFVLKGSPRLLHELRDFMLNNFGFGDFIFKTPDHQVVGRATNLKQLEEQLKYIPAESINYHASRNHFSSWLKARTEFELASRLRPKKVSDFSSIEELRQMMLLTIQNFQTERQRGIIADFRKDTFNPKNTFARIGGGSLGGKARGLGFVNSLISRNPTRVKFEGIEISVPSAVVIATDAFDYFLEANNLISIALNETDDNKILNAFINAGNFPAEIREKLTEFLDIIRGPLAVRSSSLLEDSQFQPFAGVYETFMIRNNHEDLNVRLEELIRTIKCVYASTFFKKTKDYMKMTEYRLEEEKMAVIVQRLVGADRNGKFYPDFAGVAKSYNFYPIAPQKSTDGIAMVALGLGKTVVDGGNAVRFCPVYPKHMLQFFNASETVRNGQQDFYALNMTKEISTFTVDNLESSLEKYALDLSEKDGTLAFVGSTYSRENDAVYDGISRHGRRVVTFAPILKHKVFPLADILKVMLQMGTWGMGTNVEIEFAVNLDVPPGERKEFAMLQMRPLVISSEAEELSTDHLEDTDLICKSSQVLGNGAIKDIYDVVFVDYYKYDRAKSRDVAREVSAYNNQLVDAKRPYLLVGVGRWGSFDHWLGIPVTWDQIAGAAVIVESGFKDFAVTPSQGSHFFQNITSFRVGYFTINENDKNSFIDWEWLNEQKALSAMDYVKHLRFEKPITVKIRGHENWGVITRPGVG
ncbi:MAG: histidine kinase [Ignavibacteriaceae bacterium]|nr:histidine kinase [Ignavibacteriaceae bacterium]